MTLHSLRHTVATWALAGGTDVKTGAAILGHSAASTTLNVYGHTVVGLQAPAIEEIGDLLERAQVREATREDQPA